VGADGKSSYNFGEGAFAAGTDQVVVLGAKPLILACVAEYHLSPGGSAEVVTTRGRHGGRWARGLVVAEGGESAEQAGSDGDSEAGSRRHGADMRWETRSRRFAWCSTKKWVVGGVLAGATVRGEIDLGRHLGR
jgi:hypothetical protein